MAKNEKLNKYKKRIQWEFNPITRVKQSKKKYNRKNKNYE